MRVFADGWLRRLPNLVGLVALVLMMASSAHADCGDVNDDGSIGVTDGVAVLRNAAGLGECPLAVCDVDGSGGVTVVDGVRVLRRAAGLTVELTCVSDERSPQERQVFGGYQKNVRVTGIIEQGLDAAASAAASVAATITCPGGGTVTDSATGVVYDQCRVRDTVCSGTATIANRSFRPSLQCQDLTAGQPFDVTGDVEAAGAGATRTLTGSVGGSQAGSSFGFTYDRLTLDDNEVGGRSRGQVDIEGALFGDFFQDVNVFFPGHNPATGAEDPGFADVVGARAFSPTMVLFFGFNLNLATGKLTPN